MYQGHNVFSRFTLDPDTACDHSSHNRAGESARDCSVIRHFEIHLEIALLIAPTTLQSPNLYTYRIQHAGVHYNSWQLKVWLTHPEIRQRMVSTQLRTAHRSLLNFKTSYPRRLYKIVTKCKFYSNFFSDQFLFFLFFFQHLFSIYTLTHYTCWNNSNRLQYYTHI